MKEILHTLALALRQLGFKGSGQNFRKVDGDFILVVNFQSSRSGDVFYVNLGAQPMFIPAEGEDMPDPRRLKAHECVLRTRVGESYPWTMTERATQELVASIESAQNDFFGRAQTLRAAIENDSLEALAGDFSAGSTEARAMLHLARACVALGKPWKARELVARGMELASDRATILRVQLACVLETIDEQNNPTAPFQRP